MLNTNIKHPFARNFRKFLRQSQITYTIYQDGISIHTGLLADIRIEFKTNYMHIRNVTLNSFMIAIPYDPLNIVLFKMYRYEIINTKIYFNLLELWNKQQQR